VHERLARLSRALPQDSNSTAERQAAVAILVRGSEVLLMRRAEREGDRWSGQISLPGGHRDAGDRDLLATAVRETQEEVHVELSTQAEFLGCLPSLQARSDGGLHSMWITPFLFQATSPIAPQPSDEAPQTFWLPLDRAQRGEFDAPYPWPSKAAPKRKLPSWRFEEHTIWGMTYHILRDLNQSLF